jgi:Dehydrogenases with different specificities (related to short-chain alcohol dehydrogenases)
MEGTFKGKRALITGGGGGIGKEIVLLLKRKGANVVIIDRSKNDLEALKKEIECDTIIADLSDAEQAKKAAERALPVDLLVNCAGVNNLQPFLETTVENFEETINVNTRAIMIVSQVVARNMVEQKRGGSIVSISSIASALAFQDHTTYCISKGALDQLTRCMANELGHYGIRTNAVAPAMTMTPLGRKAWSDPAKSKPMLEKIPLGRFNETIDIANVVAFLLSDEASMMNGTILAIDGGFCIRA